MYKLICKFFLIYNLVNFFICIYIDFNLRKNNVFFYKWLYRSLTNVTPIIV